MPGLSSIHGFYAEEGKGFENIDENINSTKFKLTEKNKKLINKVDAHKTGLLTQRNSDPTKSMNAFKVSDLSSKRVIDDEDISIDSIKDLHSVVDGKMTLKIGYNSSKKSIQLNPEDDADTFAFVEGVGFVMSKEMRDRLPDPRSLGVIGDGAEEFQALFEGASIFVVSDEIWDEALSILKEAFTTPNEFLKKLRDEEETDSKDQSQPLPLRQAEQFDGSEKTEHESDKERKTDRTLNSAEERRLVDEKEYKKGRDIETRVRKKIQDQIDFKGKLLRKRIEKEFIERAKLFS